jgi:hypothetical protein
VRLVFAATGNVHAMATLRELRPPNVLVSFAYKKTLHLVDYRPAYLLIDSGAFTAWNAGRPVALAEYLAFARELRADYPDALFINLDVIPGQAGRDPSRAEREAAMRRSLEHADALRAAGLRVMEVFHQGENVSFFEQLLARRRDGEVLGLSPRNDVSLKARVEWLREVLGTLLVHYERSSLPPTHGLAATAKAMLAAFPFYSADSSSWNLGYRYGHALKESFALGRQTSFPSSRPLAVQNQLTRTTLRRFMRLERFMNTLWAERGVVWDS